MSRLKDLTCLHTIAPNLIATPSERRYERGYRKERADHYAYEPLEMAALLDFNIGELLRQFTPQRARIRPLLNQLLPDGGLLINHPRQCAFDPDDHVFQAKLRPLFRG
jgi:hypothetical protein